MAFVDQPDLWATDEPVQQDDAAMDVGRTSSGVSGDNPGHWQRVPYTENYQPTPGVLTGRDVYNAWCYVQQEAADGYRRAYGENNLEVTAIERNIWRWAGRITLGSQKDSFEEMAQLLTRMIFPKADDPPLPDRFRQVYGNSVQTEKGVRFSWMQSVEE